jgi:6-phosphogluconolactonase (cycloisomerase 2 family)
MKRLILLATCAALLCGTTSGAQGKASGAVFTMTNATSGNEVLRFLRSPDGALHPAGAFATGGTGTGAGLGNQGGLALTRGNRFLLAVNAGSHEISVFRVRRHGLTLTAKVPSGGRNPVSVAVHRHLVYVLNAGGTATFPDSITGFRLHPRGQLTSIPNSTRVLSANATGPAQVGFSPRGGVLVVTEKATDNLVTFVVDRAGRPGTRKIIKSEGQTPFGFGFARRDTLVVSEATGGMPSTVSSYRVGRDGSLTPITSALAIKQRAACWVAITRNGRYGYTTNTASSSVTGLWIGRHGRLALLDANGLTGSTGPGSRPIDMAFSKGDRFLYVLNAGNWTISAFRVIRKDGALFQLAAAAVSGLPAGTNGLAAM